MPHKPSPSVDKGSIVFLGVSTAAAAQEKVHTKKNGVPIVVEVKPLPSSKLEAQPTGDDEDPRSWFVVFGAFCCIFASFGYVNSWGVFQAYYQEHFLSESSAPDIAWIGSIQHSLLFLPGLIARSVGDLLSLYLGTALLVIAVFLTPECDSYIHFLLCQGIATGLACGLFLVPVTRILEQWFRSRKELIFALLMTGASIGGTIFPIALRELLRRVEFAWAVRVIGFIILLFLLVGNMVIGLRLRLRQATSPLASGTSRQENILSRPLQCLSTFLIFLGANTRKASGLLTSA
ncbi:hypothetical protein VNI00_010217 [Paramarasmius palmivorus]|uniref:Uncharacterized protein n=1 Tax=Paramarasmius palmivorus TaxID=297713 RepID=A0AAW0CMC0_9AGAR